LKEIAMKKTFACIILSCLFIGIVTLAALAQPPANHDALEEMLTRLGISQKDLGFRPQGYWTRYPDPQDIPFKRPAFDGLMSDPLVIYDFMREMALAGEDYLNPQYLAANSNALLKTSFYLGARNYTAQFRDYSASLWAEVPQDEPLLSAIRAIYQETGRVYRFNAMNKASDFPLIEKDLRAAIAPINPQVQQVVARTVYHLLTAWHWRQIAMRNVDWQKASDCWRIRHLGETQFDGLEYFPQIDDCARDLDFNSLIYASYKLLESSEQLADTLAALKKSAKGIDWKKQNLNVETPIGRLVLAGTGEDKHEYSDLFLLVDFGGNDVYRGAVGSTPSLEIPISLAVDLEGDDEYVNDDEYLPSQGSGIFGAGMLLDVSGKDKYVSKRLAQGAGFLGVGILADLTGDDDYTLWTDGQGGAYFGIGVSMDGGGNDTYQIYGDGQGYGGVGGVGSLLDYTGNDHYYAEPDAKVVFRPDYHAKDGKANYSYAQGCGVGRRGDITDGHSWAGGIGTLVDLSGNDVYEAAQWAQGCGYWYGSGFLWDGGGDDKYTATGWSQAAGAHFCIGALVDEGGNDQYTIWAEQSQGIGFGHDFTVALFMDRSGDDVYKVGGDGLGFAINMSDVFCFDLDGKDTYVRNAKNHAFGWNNWEQNNPPVLGTFPCLYANQVCLFGDFAGQDSYLMADSPDGKTRPDSLMREGGQFFSPTTTQRDTLSNKRYYGLGVDLTNWSGPAIEAFRDKMQKKWKK
jgi:hypothetical protein